MKQPLSQKQRETIVYGVLCIVLLLVVMQLWLLTATMNAYLGGDESVIWPAAVVSIACFGVLRFVLGLARESEKGPSEPTT